MVMMSAQIEATQENRPRLIQIQRSREVDGDTSRQNSHAPLSPVEDLREEAARGFLYAHSRANINSSKLLEVASFSYALIELLAERGLYWKLYKLQYADSGRSALNSGRSMLTTDV